MLGTNEISCKADAGSSKGKVEWSIVAEEGGKGEILNFTINYDK